MHQLSARKREQQPAAPPPRPLDAAPLAPNPPLVLRMIICKLRCPAQSIYSNRHSQLLRWVYRQHKPRQAGPDRRGEARSERLACPLIPLPERTRFGRQEMCAQPREEAEENPVEE